ncbi:MAG: hypothetical protein RJA52_562 [Bacteroidota bacterium]|jgi:glycerol-3-phosphate dehydrogenase
MESFDVIVIGGGATGLGIAVDAASRGYKVILIEKSDFGKGTSSRSTKLVHGGVRYLQNGDVFLVFQALRERGYLIENAPHLVEKQEFIIPIYQTWKIFYFGLGLKIYDFLSGKHRIGKSRILSVNETVHKIPNVKRKGLKGGILYYDGIFDDARMIICLLLTAVDHGAKVLNYSEVIGLKKSGNKINGVEYKERWSGTTNTIYGKAIINATGVFADQIFKLDDNSATKKIVPSQGVHLVLDEIFLGNKSALLVPETSDGRVLFAVPWNGKTILGTTDTKVNIIEEDPIPGKDEIDFILQNAADYLENAPTKKDVKSVFAGLRPLAAPKSESGPTKEVSRSHKIVETDSGLVSILGGKWTTYRKMAEDTLDYCIQKGKITFNPCQTKSLQLNGYTKKSMDTKYKNYGTLAKDIQSLSDDEKGNVSLASAFFITPNMIRWSVRFEMAKTIDDILSRRIRGLFIDAQESINIAPLVAQIMAKELNKEEDWIEEQLEEFNFIAQKYLL